MGSDWKLDGSYFETCNCEAACQCVFINPPNGGECKVLIAWHVDSGNMGEISLDGLNVALAVYSPGHMLETPWQAALYIDGNANAEQQEALTKIFGGQAGGHIGVLAEHVGEVKGVSSLPMSFEANGNGRSLRIEGVAEAVVAAIEGQGGAEVHVSNHPVAISPGHPAVVGKSEKFSYQDHGFSWEFSGKNSFQAPFNYQGP